MILYHITPSYNISNILKKGLLTSKSNWLNLIYLTSSIEETLELFPHIFEHIEMSVLEVTIQFQDKLIVDPLHPIYYKPISFGYPDDILPKHIKKVL